MKNKIKLTTVFLVILLMISSFCFAEQAQTPIEPRTSEVEQINVTDEAVTTNLENDDATADIDVNEEVSQETQEIYEGDLYIFEDNVNMDKLVDGNVYIIGNDVTITGQIAGNLFVIADNLKIGDETSATTYNGYVFYNIYALANKATLYGSCYDLYVLGNDITIDSSFYLYRDLKIGGKDANIYGTIGRNVDANVKTLNFQKDDSTTSSTVYGNLNYSPSSKIDAETLKPYILGELNLLDTDGSSISFTKVKTYALMLILFLTIVLILILTVIFKIILSLIRKSKKSSSNISEKEKSDKKESEDSTEDTTSDKKDEKAINEDDETIKEDKSDKKEDE